MSAERILRGGGWPGGVHQAHPEDRFYAASHATTSTAGLALVGEARRQTSPTKTIAAGSWRYGAVYLKRNLLGDYRRHGEAIHRDSGLAVVGKTKV